MYLRRTRRTRIPRSDNVEKITLKCFARSALTKFLLTERASIVVRTFARVARACDVKLTFPVVSTQMEGAMIRHHARITSCKKKINLIEF